MIKYKIREEKQGAMLFDQDKGQVIRLSESEYQDILKGNTKDFNYLFDNNNNSNKPLFKLFRSQIPRKELPSDCLSAPSKVYFEITRKCNLNCTFCYNKSNDSFSKELSKEQIFSLLDELSELGTFEIRFTGGEPTIHPDFFEIIEYSVKLGFFVSLGTNGIWSEDVLDKIKTSGIKIIIVSLDGHEEYNDSIRGSGTFNKTILTLKNLRHNKDLILKINCVLTRHNKKYIDYIINLADFLGIDAVNFATLKLGGRASGNKYNTLTQKDMFEIVQNINRLRQNCKVKIQTYLDIIDKPTKEYMFQSSLLNKKTCAAGIEVAAISPFGEVYGCVVSPANNPKSQYKQLFTAGKLSENKFIDIWLDSSRWSVFRDLKKIKSKKCLDCRFYTKTCFGNCVVESYLHKGELNSDNPYCFVDMVEEKNGN